MKIIGEKVEYTKEVHWEPETYSRCLVTIAVGDFLEEADRIVTQLREEYTSVSMNVTTDTDVGRYVISGIGKKEIYIEESNWESNRDFYNFKTPIKEGKD